MPEQAEEVVVTAGNRELPGSLTIPDGARGVVIFAHGSGSSGSSPRDRAVAEHLNAAGLGTLLFDLLTPEEERDRSNVFDIELLASRLVGATGWLHARPSADRSSIGYFGASTGAGAALWAAAEIGDAIRAVVSRGGRPDLAGPQLERVASPTLLIVGGCDTEVLALNEQAHRQLRGATQVAVVPDATHLFEEPGALDEVSNLARDWFIRYLAAGPEDGRPD